MKIMIISAWRDRYAGDERARAFPALSAVHLAALCPPHVEVQVWHEQIRPVDPSHVNADLVALTSTTGSSGRMYELADRLRERGITVILGGPHVSLLPQEALEHADSIAVGDGEYSFREIVSDFERRRMSRVYRQPEALPLSGLPIPRYDLFEDEFLFRCFVQATRGCPFQCSFCTLKALDRNFRTRPVQEVIRDIEACDARNWLQRKFVWFWDDNLTASPDYARELFSKLRPLQKWWWAQCSIEVAQHDDVLRLAAESGCLAVFVGIETFSEANLTRVRKRQNKVEQYRKAVKAFHDVGIAVHAGLVVGLEEDTTESLRRIPEAIRELGIDLPFVNLLTPFPKTLVRSELESECRLLRSKWQEHNGAAVTFLPRWMTPNELEQAYWEVHHQLYSLRETGGRIWRSVRQLKSPGFALNSCANVLFSFQNFFWPDHPWPDEGSVAEEVQCEQANWPLNGTLLGREEAWFPARERTSGQDGQSRGRAVSQCESWNLIGKKEVMKSGVLRQRGP